MKRRESLVALAALAAAPLAKAQTDRPRRVLALLQTERSLEPPRKAIGEVLRARGWIEGRNLLLELRAARMDGQDLPKVVAESLRASPDVIMVTASPLAAALKSTGTNIPCVFVAVWDPIALGLAASLARPGGTYTGVSNAVPEGFFGKQVELLREAVPGLKRVALLANPRHPIYQRDSEKNLKTVRDQGVVFAITPLA